MNGAAWRRVLTAATKEAQTEVARVAAQGESSRSVGVGASGDVTLVADRLAERSLLRGLHKAGGVRVVSEEAGYLGGPGDGPVAVLDPLDGSSNFERGIQFYCSSAAIAEGPTLASVRLGLVRNLVNGDVYWAEAGKGATKNGRRIRSSGVASLAQAVADIDLSRGPVQLTARMGPLIARVKRQVHYGANALEVCLLAEGRIDAFVDVRKKMRSTDFAAAYLIAKEAGAMVTDEGGGALGPSLDLESRFSVVAAGNPQLHRQLLRTLAG